MTDDRDDPLLDACLAEVLGGVAPPDLSGRILERLRKQQAAERLLPPAATAATGASPTPLTPIPATPTPATPALVAPSTNGSGPGHLSVARRTRRRRHPSWMGFAAALSLLAVAGVAGWLAMHELDRQGRSPVIADADPPPGAAQSPVDRDRLAPAPRPPRDRLAQGSQERPHRAGDAAPREASPPSAESTPPSAFGQRPDFAQRPAPTAEPAVRPRAEPLYDDDVVALIDRELARAWADYKVEPAPPATDAELARRTYLRMLGRIPTVAELERFVADKAPDKKRRLVDQLLSGSEYADELAAHWAGFWTNVLIGRSGGVGDDSLADRHGLQEYLRQSLLANKPYNELAHELIAAEGSNRPDDPDYNGAVNFLLANHGERATLATDRTSRVFLGQQLHCAQCHHHHASELAQQDYWQLNAFFRQMVVQRDRRSGAARLVDRDFVGESGDLAEADIFYEQPNGLRKVAYPVFLDGSAIDPDGRVEQVRRRQELARRVAAAPELSQAVVNRLWAHFLGRGFTRVVDDMGPHHPPSHPELLAQLAGQFEAHDYDLKSLTRWIALSRAFDRSSVETPQNIADAPDAGSPPLFARYYTRQMQAEELYESLLLVAEARRQPGSVEHSAARAAWLGQFARNMNTDEGNEIIHFDGSVRQSLDVMHGDLMKRATSLDHDGILSRVTKSKLSLAEKARHLFLASVAREPTRRELAAVESLAAAHQGNETTALQDIWWALLNSNEFILDH